MDTFIHTFFDWQQMLAVFPVLLTEGIRNTLLIAVLAPLLGHVFAMLLLARMPRVRLIARIYVDIFRGLPTSGPIRGTSPVGYAVPAVGLISANLSAIGHHMRLDISSSNLRRCDVNSNTGRPAFGDRTSRIARNTIHCGESRLRVSVVDGA